MRLSRLLAYVFALLAGLGVISPAVATAAPPPLGSGSVLFSANGVYRCTVAFAARSAQGAPHLITGPGCEAPGVTLFSGNNVLVGVVRGNRFPSGYSIVMVTNPGGWTLVPWIDTPTGRVVIQGSRETPIGGAVCRLGRTTGWRCGVITAKNVTVAFPQGTIGGLTRTNICAEPGDLGAAFVSGNQAQGVLVGASGNCTTGGVSYFVPVNKILATFGLGLLTGS